eukprot:CAMPEP_0177518422 /NCGR_PEP_ID=MMETSP0369-20130122/46517_1 /TAXON_ID=447022 ORGANISM="Scrippsiella hangoei-like, Strain SHHI-4" /NCGR_SAMPLE_ID=MMETSP0369 /ASSEMBLY_ACC=CAM_ASM_000364 /LENGTH=34 /DNA_ID= /DNA_START= /DNA_END= /DNA_ORIENTATION=
MATPSAAHRPVLPQALVPSPVAETTAAPLAAQTP